MEGVRKALTHQLVSLIRLLTDLNLVDRDELISLIGEENVFVVHEVRKLNYRELADVLNEMPVFLPIDRKKAYYAKKRLEEITGRKVVKKRVMLGTVRGYLFYLHGT